jgi:hypothetical protein
LDSATIATVSLVVSLTGVLLTAYTVLIQHGVAVPWRRVVLFLSALGYVISAVFIGNRANNLNWTAYLLVVLLVVLLPRLHHFLVRRSLGAKMEAIVPKLETLGELFGLRKDPRLATLWNGIGSPTACVWLDSVNEILGHFATRGEEIEKQYRTDRNGFVSRLHLFRPSDYFRHLAGDAFRLHEASSAHPDARKDHILCKLIGSSHRMLRSVAEAKGPERVKGAYNLSVARAKQIQHAAGALLWASNMAHPSTYILDPDVRDYYEDIFPILDEHPLIDARRVHLFYKSMRHSAYRNQFHPEAEYLLGTLVAEYLIGIDSRVLWLHGSKPIYPDSPEFGRKAGCLFLLDYVLAYAPGPPGSFPGSGGSVFSILCADFMGLPEVKVPIGLPERETREEIDRITAATKKWYSGRGVYDLREPTLFPLFQEHFLAMWNLSGYTERVAETDAKDSVIRRYTRALKRYANSYDVFEFMNEVSFVRAVGQRYYDNPDVMVAFGNVFEPAAKMGGLDLDYFREKVQEALTIGVSSGRNPTLMAEVKRRLDQLQVRRFSRDGVAGSPCVKQERAQTL